MRKNQVRRLALLGIAGLFVAAAPGALGAPSGAANASDDLAYRRLDEGDDAATVWTDLDADGLDNDANSNSGSRNGTTTAFAATRTRNRDGDDTRGNDGTSDGDNTVGQDGTGGGNNSRSASRNRSGD